MTNIFRQINFNPILFNLTQNFPTFFKTRRRIFPDFFGTLPNNLTRPHFLPSNFEVREGGNIWVPKIANFAKYIFEFIGIAKFRYYITFYIYFLPLSSQKFLVLIASTSEGWKVESNLEQTSRFEQGTPGLGIRRLYH